jgi:hypothetical protein
MVARVLGGSFASSPIKVLNIAITSVSLKDVADSVSSMVEYPAASSFDDASKMGRTTRAKLVTAVCNWCVAVICKIHKQEIILSI